MKKFLTILLAIILLFTNISFVSFAKENITIEDFLKSKLAYMVEEGRVKGAILSIVDNSNVYSRGLGFADEKNNIKTNEENTAFRIGSISKTFVALTAQKLVQDGLLDLNIDIRNYLEDDFPEFKYSITMHNLLTHTAGFEDMITGIAVHNIKDSESLYDCVRKYKPQQVFKPGEVISYSNYGIALAAYIIQNITNTDFAEYVQKEILTPLNMKNTSFKNDFSKTIVSKAYNTKGKEAKEPYVNIYPEGSMVSTANDMAKYISYMLNDNEIILKQEFKNELLMQHFTMSNEFDGIGYTWNRHEQNGIKYYAKKGETINFYSRIVICPELKYGFFISFNTYVPSDELDNIISEAINILVGENESILTDKVKQTEDISGWYIGTRTSFTNIEKIFRFILESKAIHIKGNINNGFTLNGEKLIPLGNNFYNSPIGKIKYIKSSNNTFLATESALSFVKTDIRDSTFLQASIIIIFVMTTLVSLILSIISVIRKNGMLLQLLKLSFTFVLLITFIITIIYSLMTYSILKMIIPIQIISWLLVVLSISNIFELKSILKKDISLFNKIIFIIHNASSIAFAYWLWFANIL